MSAKSFKEKAASDFGTNCILTLILSFVCGIPIWLYLLAKHVFNPHGFLENLVLVGFGTWALGATQGLLLLLFIGGLLKIWLDD